MDPDRYTVKELTRLLHMTPRQLLYRVHKYDVPTQRRGRAYILSLSELLMQSMWHGLPEREKQS